MLRILWSVGIQCCIHGSEFLLMKLFFGQGETPNTRMVDIAQLKYSLGTEKGIWIPVPLPNIHWNKNGTAPKGAWEGQRDSLFPYGLVAWELRKRSDETEVQISQPMFCLLG